jgi:hypothetical protein
MRAVGGRVTLFTEFNKLFFDNCSDHFGPALFWGTGNNAEGVGTMEKKVQRIEDDKDWS